MSTHLDSDASDQNEPASDQQAQKLGVPVLCVSELETGYDETQVLWDVSLEVQRGEIVALVGANGAGKSTLLSALSGLLPIWKGTITFADQNITRSQA